MGKYRRYIIVILSSTTTNARHKGRIFLAKTEIFEKISINLIKLYWKGIMRSIRWGELFIIVKYQILSIWFLFLIDYQLSG